MRKGFLTHLLNLKEFETASKAACIPHMVWRPLVAISLGGLSGSPNFQ